MATRLSYIDLPEEIKNKHKPKEIHKISKPNKTLINIHLTNHEKVNYKKAGDSWNVI